MNDIKLLLKLLCKKTNSGNFSVTTNNYRSKRNTAVLIDDNVISFSINRINHKIFFKR